MAGLVIFVGLGVASRVMFATNSGGVLGLGGALESVIPISPAWLPGLVVAVMAALIYYSKDLWWMSLVAVCAASVVLVALVVVGNLLFTPSHMMDAPNLTWWPAAVVEASQSAGVYAVTGILAVRAIQLALRRGGARQVATSHAVRSTVV